MIVFTKPAPTLQINQDHHILQSHLVFVEFWIKLKKKVPIVLTFSLMLCRCSGQYRGKDATAGICSEQEESPGSAKPKPLSA